MRVLKNWDFSKLKIQFKNAKKGQFNYMEQSNKPVSVWTRSWRVQGQNISVPGFGYEYKYDRRVETMALVPEQMRGFCSLKNSFWLREANDGE